MVNLLIDEFGLQVTDQDEVCMPDICVRKAYISKDHGIIFVCKHNKFVCDNVGYSIGPHINMN